MVSSAPAVQRVAVSREDAHRQQYTVTWSQTNSESLRFSSTAAVTVCSTFQALHGCNCCLFNGREGTGSYGAQGPVAGARWPHISARSRATYRLSGSGYSGIAALCWFTFEVLPQADVEGHIGVIGVHIEAEVGPSLVPAGEWRAHVRGETSWAHGTNGRARTGP